MAAFRPPDHIVVRARSWGDPVEAAYRLEPAETEAFLPTLITAYQAQEIVDGLAALGVTARPDS